LTANMEGYNMRHRRKRNRTK